MRPEFVVSVGDLIEGYTDDPAVLDREWDEFEGFVGRLQMPFFYVPGNHDMSNAVMAEEWQCALRAVLLPLHATRTCCSSR